MSHRKLPHIGWWLLAIVPVVALAIVTPPALRYHHAQRLAADAESAGGRVYFERSGPDWLWDLAELLEITEKLTFFETRLTVVDLGDARIDDAWLQRIAGE